MSKTVSPKTNRILWHRMVTYKIPSAISRVFSTNLPWLLAVTFHISSVHSLYTMMNGMSLHPYPKGGLTQGVKFPYPLSTWHLIHSLAFHTFTSLPDMDTTRISAEKCLRSRSYPWSKYPKNCNRSTFTVQITFMIKTSKEAHVLPKLTADDKASSKTHLVRLMHNVVASKFKIFSVAKARCWNTRLSPKTPKVFPVLSSSSKIQFLG